MTVAVARKPAIGGDVEVVRNAITVLLAAFLYVLFRSTIYNPLLLDPAMAWAIVCYAFAVPVIALQRATGARPRTTPLDGAALAYVLCVLVTWPASVNRTVTALAVVALGGHVAVYWAIRVTAEHQPRVVRVVVAALIAGIAIVQWQAADYHLRHGLATRLLIIPTLEWNGRAGVSFLAAIQFGLLVGAGLVANRRADRIAMLIVVIVATAELLLLYSRGPWIAALAVLSGGFVLAYRMRRALPYTMMLTAVAVVVLLIATPYTSHLAKVAVGLEPGSEAGPASRLLLWRNAVPIIRSHLVAGVGLGNFMSVHQALFPIAYPEFGTNESGFSHPHNIFLQQFAEVGILGGAAYAALWAIALAGGWRRSDRSSRSADVAAAAFLAVLAICVVNFGENMFLEGVAAERCRLHTIGWMILAVVAAEWSRARASTAQPDTSAAVLSGPPSAARGSNGARLVFLSMCALFAVYEVWNVFLRHAPAVDIQGAHARLIDEFGDRAVVSQTFAMGAGGITAFDLRASTDRPATLLVQCQLSDVTETAPGVDEADILRHRAAAPGLFSQTWFATLKHVDGVEWRRVPVPGEGTFGPGIYELRLQLIDAQPDGTAPSARNPLPAGERPRVALMASKDNVLGGGSLWIRDIRQIGSLSLRVYSHARNAFEQFRADVAGEVPSVLRSVPVLIAVAVAYQVALVAIIYVVAIAKI